MAREGGTWSVEARWVVSDSGTPWRGPRLGAARRRGPAGLRASPWRSCWSQHSGAGPPISWLRSRSESKGACEELCRPPRGSRRLFCSSAGDERLRGDRDVPSVPRVCEEDDLLASDPRSETTRAGSLLERGIPGGLPQWPLRKRTAGQASRTQCLPISSFSRHRSVARSGAPRQTESGARIGGETCRCAA